jgi:hypothetical protein
MSPPCRPPLHSSVTRQYTAPVIKLASPPQTAL